MTGLLEKLKSLLKGIDQKTILITCLVVAVGYLTWVSWWTPKPVDVQGLLADQRATLTKQFEANVKARDAQIKDLAARLTVSNGKYAALAKRLTEVRNETIVPPKTNKELRDRFVALGFPPK
jgi:uncharacterized membrane protein YccC